MLKIPCTGRTVYKYTSRHKRLQTWRLAQDGSWPTENL